MGEARSKANLGLVPDAAPKAVTVRLTPRATQRLAAAFYASEGAAAVAQAALAQAQALRARYDEMILAELEDVRVPEGYGIRHLAEDGRIVVAPPKST